MEKYLKHGLAQNIPLYDCRPYHYSPEDLEARGVKNPILGGLFIAYGLIAEICYVLAMVAMWQKELKNHSCYKIMIILGIYDMLAIGVNSILTGYFWIVGSWYCSHPETNYIFGAIGLGLWCGACMNCFVLVLNRLVDLWKPNLMHAIFGGSRTYLVLLLPFFYSVYFVFFTPPLIFNSNMTAWFFDPFITLNEQETVFSSSIQMTFQFYNYPHTVNNLLIVVATCVLYTFVVAVLMKKFRQGREAGSRGITKGQISIIIQTTTICMANLIAALIYVYMQFEATPKWLILIGHISWQAGHGMPAFVYLLLNKTIQFELRRIFCRKNFVYNSSMKIGDTVAPSRHTGYSTSQVVVG